MSDFICQLLQLCLLKVSFGAIWDFEQLSKDLSTFLDVWVVCGVPSFPAGVSFTPVWKTVSSPVYFYGPISFSQSVCPPSLGVFPCVPSFTSAVCLSLELGVLFCSVLLCPTPLGCLVLFQNVCFPPSLAVSPLSLGVFPCVAGRVPSLPFQLLGLS